MNPDLKWKQKHFSSLTTNELYDIIQLRNAVFVVEQNVVYQDADGRDKNCHHLCGYDGENLVAYCRLLAPGAIYPEASIGRVITATGHRSRGAGKTLIKNAITECGELFGNSGIRLSGQLYLEKFYSSFGFITVSDIYLEDTIEHVEMLLPPRQA